jgi:hypothetical protein
MAMVTVVVVRGSVVSSGRLRQAGNKTGRLARDKAQLRASRRGRRFGWVMVSSTLEQKSKTPAVADVAFHRLK